ncbi:hypothetical protein MMC10_008623 [Thelotrema lepadinum]|nr:hypothetical protein [Thelotrema lepadinum]
MPTLAAAPEGKWDDINSLFIHHPMTSDTGLQPTPTSELTPSLQWDSSPQSHDTEDSLSQHQPSGAVDVFGNSSLASRSTTVEMNEQSLANHCGFPAGPTATSDPERANSSLEESMLLLPESTLADMTNASLSAFGELPTMALALNPTTCLCNPCSLRILEPLQYAELQSHEAAVDRSLELLRTGVSVCQSSLSCVTCWQNSSSLAFLLLMQGVMKCYTSLLASREEHSRNIQNKSAVTIGAFEVDTHLHNEVVSAVIKAEMTKAAEVLLAYEAALQHDGQSNSRLLQATKHFSRALKEEFQI